MPFPALILVGAAVGAGLSGASASRSNSAVRRAAYQNYQNIDKQILQTKLAGADQSRIQSQKAQSTLGSFLNAISDKTGASYRAVASQIATDAAIDSQNIVAGTNQAIEALNISKQNIATQAAQQTQSVPFAALGGAASGASLAGAFSSAISSVQEANQANQAAKDYQSIIQEGDPAKLQALNQGIPPSAILSGKYNDYIKESYSNTTKLRSLGLEAAKLQRDYYQQLLERSQYRRYR